MFKALKVGFPALFISLLFPVAASGQSITTSLAPISNVPIDNPVALALLVVGLAFSGWWAIRRGYKASHVVSLLLLVALVTAGIHSTRLVAQVLSSFTNPAGETRAITISPIIAGGFKGFEPVDFTNNAGQALKITGLVEPDYAQCFATHSAGTLLPPGPPLPSPPPTCSVGLILANGATCRVDVEAICRNLVPAQMLNSVSPSLGAASGGVGVTLIGTGFTGATGVTFGGVSATSVSVVSSTTVTAVTPAHATGAVDVVITTPSGSATLVNGFTYVTTAVGQASYGGTIAALNGGLNNLIAATADNSTGIEWGGFGTVTNATSSTDGATNSATVVAVLGANGGTPYAAQLCTNYEVDSQGNTPCEAGNTCYNDWVLPSGNNLTSTGQLNALFTNRAAIGGFSVDNYWSSTELNAIFSHGENFSAGASISMNKNILGRVRCVRTFTP